MGGRGVVDKGDYFLKHAINHLKNLEGDDNMTKKIVIATSAAFGILAIVALVVWYNNATAQYPREPELPTFLPGSGGVAICATNNYVYVLSGNMLYQFNAEDLKLIRKAPIEKEPRFQPGKPGMMEDRFPPSRKTLETEE
jgi:hypothetical protein